MQPWDRQPFDSDESFMWFVAYRDMIPPRRLSKVARSVPGKVCPPLQALLTLLVQGVQAHFEVLLRFLGTFRRAARHSAARILAPALW